MRQDATAMTEDEIAAGLCAWADGSLSESSAVGLIIDVHRHTLTRLLDHPEVRTGLSTATRLMNHDDPNTTPKAATLVWPNWGMLTSLGLMAIRHSSLLPASFSPRAGQILIIAAHLCGFNDMEEPVALSTCLSGLDGTHTRLVLAAIARHQNLSTDVLSQKDH